MAVGKNKDNYPIRKNLIFEKRKTMHFYIQYLSGLENEI